MLDEHGLKHDLHAKARQDVQGHPLHMFINELVAVRAAMVIIRSGGHLIRPRPETVHDLVTTLRYHPFSPDSLRISLEGMIEQQRAG